MLIDHEAGPMPLSSLLPEAFGPENLNDSRNARRP
jgi:hypothetical protein